MKRRFWTADEDRMLRDLYPGTLTADLARRLRRTERAVYARAAAFGLSKSADYLATPQASRFRRGSRTGSEHRFPKGNVPHNKGKHYQPGGRSVETRFTVGAMPQTWVPVGTEVIDADGYLRRKVSDRRDCPSRRNWSPVHVLLWEEENGAVPRGHAVVFINGDKRDIRGENLELVTRAELMRRNTIHRYPAELKAAIRLAAKLRRTISRAEEKTA